MNTQNEFDKMTDLGDDAILKHYGFDVERLTKPQKELILQPLNDAEGYSQDNELTMAQAFKLWLNRLDDLKLDGPDKLRAIKMHTRPFKREQGGSANQDWVGVFAKDNQRKFVSVEAADRSRAMLEIALEKAHSKIDQDFELIDVHPAIYADGGQLNKEQEDIIADLSEIFKETVADIEARPATTQNHYGDYMVVLSSLKKPEKTTKVLALAMMKAGANKDGVRSALRVMYGQMETGGAFASGGKLDAGYLETAKEIGRVKFDQYSSPWQIIPINPIELPKGTNGTVHRFSISSKVFDYGQEKWQKLKPVERELFSEKYLDHVTNSSWRYLAGSTQYELAVALHNALLDSVGIVAPPPKSKLPKERWVFDLYNNIEGPFDSEEAAREAQKTYRKNLPPKLAPGAMSEPYLMDAHKKVIEKLTEGEANSYVNEIKEYLKKKYPTYKDDQLADVDDEDYNDYFFEMVDDVRARFLVEEEEDRANQIVEEYMSSETKAQGGILRNIHRDRMFVSKQEWEQKYHRKHRGKKYHFATGGNAGEKYKPGDYVFAKASRFDTRIKDDSQKIPFFVSHWSHDKYYVLGDGSHYISEDELSPATEKDFNDYYGDNASAGYKHIVDSHAAGGAVDKIYVVDVMYRDGANYKKFVENIKVPESYIESHGLPEVGDDIDMEDLGFTTDEFYAIAGVEYDEEYDHNVLEVMDVRELPADADRTIILKGSYATGGAIRSDSGYTIKGRNGNYYIDDVENKLPRQTYKTMTLAKDAMDKAIERKKARVHKSAPSVENLIEANRYYASGGSLSDITVDDLDLYEKQLYHDLQPKFGHDEALTIIMNNVEGDVTQLSPKLAAFLEASLKESNELKIAFKDKHYPLKKMVIIGGELTNPTEVIIANTTLEKALAKAKWRGRAGEIDEMIFFYVPDDIFAKDDATIAANLDAKYTIASPEQYATGGAAAAPKKERSEKRVKDVSKHIQKASNFDLRISRKLAEKLLQSESSILQKIKVMCKEMGTGMAWASVDKKDLVGKKLPPAFTTLEVWITDADLTLEKATEELTHLL